MKVLLTGSGGLVGHALLTILKKEFTWLDPSRNELDILNQQQISTYIHEQKPDYIIHSAAFVNVTEAEKDRGNTQGICYQTNVVGTKNVVDAANKRSIPLIYISTGSVFHGTVDNPGPFGENDQPEEASEKNSWYGYTKYLGECTRPTVIIRIAHPLLPSFLRIKDDYLQKMMKLYHQRTLHPLFPDQLFPLTDISDVATTINTIITLKQWGIFHVASPDLVSPYDMFTYALKLTNNPIDERIQKMSIEEFYKKGNSPLRFAKYCAISSERTSTVLRIEFKKWKEVLQNCVTK